MRSRTSSNYVGNSDLFNMRGKLNVLGMWLSWRCVASGPPADFTSSQFVHHFVKHMFWVVGGFPVGDIIRHTKVIDF